MCKEKKKKWVVCLAASPIMFLRKNRIPDLHQRAGYPRENLRHRKRIPTNLKKRKPLRRGVSNQTTVGRRKLTVAL